MACCLNLSFSFPFCLSLSLAFCVCAGFFLNNKDALAIWGRGNVRGGMIYLVPLLSLSCSMPWRFSEQWVVRGKKLRPAGTEGFGSVWTQSGRYLQEQWLRELTFWVWCCFQSSCHTSVQSSDPATSHRKKNSPHFFILPSPSSPPWSRMGMKSPYRRHEALKTAETWKVYSVQSLLSCPSFTKLHPTTELNRLTANPDKTLSWMLSLLQFHTWLIAFIIFPKPLSTCMAHWGEPEQCFPFPSHTG